MHGHGFRQRWRLPVLLLGLYVLIALLPTALAATQGLAPRPWRDELATGLGMAGFTMLLMEFLLSGRFKALSARVGQDRVMQFHQLMAYVVVLFLLVHPFLYSLPMGTPPPTAPPGEQWLQLPFWPGLTGMVAWALLAVLVFLAIARDDLPGNYETWRLSHGLGAVLVALLGLHHTLEAGRYSQDGWLAAFWVVAVAVAVLSLIHVHVVIPLRQARHPLRVVSVQRAADRTWNLELEPDTEAGHPGDAFPFRAGQFAWLKFERPLFRITEHPFSIATAPSQWPRIGFTIKEAGDFTDGIGCIAPGSRAYIDGPYGHFTLDADDARPLVLVAGGVGMAPIMSLLRELAAQGTQRRIVVIQGNRTAEQRLYAEELDALRDTLDLHVHHVLSEPPADWQGHIGVPDRQLIEAVLPAPARDCMFYVCGPPEMIDALEDVLLSGLRVSPSQVNSERFRYALGTRRGSAGRLMAGAAVASLLILAGLVWFAVR